MKVIFLNTWHGQLRDELRAYVQQNMHTTDAFCFQEAHGDDRLPYDDLLTDDFALHAVNRQNESNGSWYGNVIYVRKNFHIAETGGLFTEDTEGHEVGIAAYLTLKINDTKLTICNVHGIPYPGDKLDSPARLYQSKTILNAFADTQNVIIGGDFNLLPHTTSIQTFSDNGYQNLIADFAIESTRNRITYEKYPEDIQYFADYAFVSPGLKVNDFIVPTEIVSDHQPLELDFDLPGNQQLVDANDSVETATAL